MINIDKSTWVKAKISDVFDKKEENDKANAQYRFDRFLKVEHMDAESLHIKRWSSQENGDEINPTFYKIFRAGQVLFPTRNPHLRRTALAHFDGICGEKTLTLEPKKDLVEERFIPFLFHSEGFYSHSTSAIIGSTNPHCRWRDIANYEFLLPPKDQQGALAELLWAMDGVIEGDIGILEKLNIYKASMEAKFLNDDTHTSAFILEVATVQRGRFSHRPRNAPQFYGGDIPFIQTAEVVESDKYIKKFTQSLNELGLSISKMFPKGTIVMTIAANIGYVGILEFDSAFTDSLVGIQAKEDVLLQDYLYYYLNNKRLDIDKLATESAQKNLSIDGFKTFKVFYPEDINRQKLIVANLDQIRTVADRVGNKLTASKTLQKSLINQIF